MRQPQGPYSGICPITHRYSEALQKGPYCEFSARIASPHQSGGK